MLQDSKETLQEIIDDIFDYNEEYDEALRSYIHEVVNRIKEAPPKLVSLVKTINKNREIFNSPEKSNTELIHFLFYKKIFNDSNKGDDVTEFSFYETFNSPQEIESFFIDTTGSSILSREAKIYFYHLIDKYSYFC